MNLIKEIENLIDSPVDPSLFPVKKGNRIFLLDCVIKKQNGVYQVFKNKTLQKQFYTKIAAVAYAKNSHRKNTNDLEIQRLDRLLEKNLIDCVFYRNQIENTEKEETRQCTKIRFEDSRAHIKDIRDKLRSFIFPQS